MSIPGEWFRRARYLLNRRRLEDDLRREMEAHREMMATPARFGNTLQLREDAGDVWGWRWLDDFTQDVRYAFRTLVLGHRTFAVTAVSMLAIGIGVTTAVFTVVSGLLLRPLPFAQPDRLVQMHGTTTLRGPWWPAVTNLDTYRRDSTSFEAIAAYEVGGRYLRDAAGTDRVMAVQTEGSFFSVLGVPGLSLTALGLAVGAAVALAAAPLVRLAPITVRRPDFVTLVPVACVIALVAVVASLVPARRAARVDPLTVLRAD